MTSQRTPLSVSGYVREDILDLPDQCQEVRIVVYDIIGELCLLVYRNLKIFASIDVLLIQTSDLPKSVDSPIPVTFYIDQSVTAIRPTHLNQQGDVQYNRFDTSTRTALGNPFVRSLENAGMDHLVQCGQFLWIGKYNVRQLPAVDPAGNTENSLSEQLTDLIANGILVQQFVSDHIGMDDLAAQLSELVGYSALAGSDATDDPDNWLSLGIAHTQAAMLLTPTLRLYCNGRARSCQEVCRIFLLSFWLIVSAGSGWH